MANFRKGPGASFSVTIGADTVQLTRSLAELQKDLSGLKKQLSAATNAQDVIKLNQAIQQTDRAIKGITGAQSLGALNTGLAKLPAGANQAGFAVGNFSRIVQDAPFSLLSGNLIAVSNNIDPLIQSFVHLKQQTGSTGAAMKALGSNLIGSGGLLLGFSLVNAAITFFSARASFAKKETEGLAKAQADANKEAGDQIAHLRTLAAVAGNTANAAKERKSAAEQLSKALKEQNVQLTAEEALNNKAAAAIDVATKAILARARARAIENRVAELSAKNLDRELKRDELTEKLTQAQKKLNAEQEKATKSGRLLISSIEGRQAQITVGNITDEIKELDQASADATKEINNLLAKVDNAGKTGGGDPVVDLVQRRIDALKKLRDEVGLTRAQQVELARLEVQLIKRDAVKAGFTREEMEDRINAAIAKIFPGEQVTSRLKIRVIGELDSALPSLDTSQQQGPRDISEALGLDKIDATKLSPVVKALQDAAKAKNELLNLSKGQELAVAITEQLTPAFEEFFGLLVSDGSSAFEQLGKSVGKLVNRLVAAVTTAAALGGIISLITGAPFGASFRGILGSIGGLPKFADGGITQGPTAGFLAKVHPNEAIIPLSRLQQFIGSANNGGGVGGSFSARIVDGGRDLFIMMEREGRRFGRNF